jgi:hypothetical protein
VWLSNGEAVKNILVFSVIIVVQMCFGEVLFSDDFNDGNDDGWAHLGSASFQVINGRYFIHAQGSRGQGKSLNGDQSGVMSTADYSVLSSLVMECGMESGLIARYTGGDQWYYRMVVKPYSSRILLERKKDTGPSVLMDQCSFTLTAGSQYWIRLEVEGDSIRGRIWEGPIDQEPEEWMLTAVDNMQGEGGSLGLFAGGYGRIPWSSIFDDVTVSVPAEQQLSSVTWASIKATGSF